MKYVSQLLVLFLTASLLISCEKQIDNVRVTYRITDFQDGFIVSYKTQSDTLINEAVEGTYTLATPWTYSFSASPGDIVYISLQDTTELSFSRVQILIDGKVYKQRTRTDDVLMPVVVSGVVPY
jgi:hypothetical protein